MSSSIHEDEKVIARPIKPRLMVGISTYGPKLTDEIEESLKKRFSMSQKKCCEICGVSLTENFRHSLSYGKGWYNACSMCYYACNLDQIPHYSAGKVVCVPYFDQSRLNAILRGLWTLDYMVSVEPDNRELEEHRESLSDIDSFINYVVQMSEGYHLVSKAEIFATTLDHLKPEDYAQRHKLLTNFLWIPEHKMFEEEIAFWAQTDYQSLHPSKMNGNIKQFMSKYTKGFDLKE